MGVLHPIPPSSHQHKHGFSDDRVKRLRSQIMSSVLRAPDASHITYPLSSEAAEEYDIQPCSTSMQNTPEVDTLKVCREEHKIEREGK